MKKSVRIGEKPPHPLYLPKDLVKEGFVGDVEIMANAKTVVILHPKASLDEIAESLEIILKDINLRRGIGTKANEQFNHKMLKRFAKDFLKLRGFRNDQIFEEYKVTKDRRFKVDMAGISSGLKIGIECETDYYPEVSERLWLDLKMEAFDEFYYFMGNALERKVFVIKCRRVNGHVEETIYTLNELLSMYEKN